jgi:hypothetical protein
LLGPQPHQNLVPQVVAPLSAGRTRRPLRPDAGQPRRRPAHPPELERTILSIRRRLQAHASRATRYSLIGSTAILAELKSLGIRPLPCERTIVRVLERNGLTAPGGRLAPLLPRQEYPGPQARASNELHQVDLVGPLYLKGSGHRYYIWIGKDAFDGAVCLRLA